jgi:hypothetical protein
VYLGFNYDLARGMQDELLRWADEQRRVKRVRSVHPAEGLEPRSEPALTGPTGDDRLEERKAS